MRKINLTGWILIGLVLGVLVGWLVGTPILPWTNPLAELFLRLLKMIIIPLIFTSIITGVTGVGDSTSFGRMGIKTLLYYLTTSFLAILTGLVLVNLLQPGVGADFGFQEVPQLGEQSLQSLGDIFYRLIPTNPIAALANGDTLAVIFFALLLGFFITRLPQPQRTLLGDIFEAGFKVMMKMTQFVINLAPVGVFALLVRVVATTGFEAFGNLGLYALAVVSGLLIHAVITLPLALRLLAGISPWRFLQAMSTALLTAFSTSSSSATLPMTLECAEDRAGISNRTSSFVLPLGATVNMDGTALYECVAAIFIAQVYGIELSFLQQMVVVVTALLASIGAAGIPMAGLVMITIILRAVGLPLEGIGLILAVDRVLDMMRTTVNVWSDSVGTAIIARSEGEIFLK
ncbi:MAG: dicarboxylate/amino acid:cation symporter [Candidatus Delongbacteria bacterium]|nr:dicarboxylate/amino acid:cation symporter [Candidatus Delongbacteria bacterium]